MEKHYQKFFQFLCCRTTVDQFFCHADAGFDRICFAGDIEGCACIEADGLAFCTLFFARQDRSRDLRIFLRRTTRQLLLIASLVSELLRRQFIRGV